MAWKIHVPRQGGSIQQGKPCMIWSQFKQNVMKKIKYIVIFTLDITIFMWLCAGFKRWAETCSFTRGCLMISMTFMNFPKPGVKFHDFSRPGKRNEIPWLFQVFHDWIHPANNPVWAFNYNFTFIVLNLYHRANSKAQWTKHNSIFMSRDVARVTHHGRQWNILTETMEGMPCCPCCRGMFWKITLHVKFFLKIIFWLFR